MPKLLVFAPCEKVIISQDENNPTLIAILSSLTLQTTAEELAKTATSVEGSEGGAVQPPMALVRWSIFSMWLREPEDDEGKDFHQTIEIVSPDDRVLLSNKMTFKFSGTARTHRLTLHVGGFPVATVGDYAIVYCLMADRLWNTPFT